jgi:hypothetical protein
MNKETLALHEAFAKATEAYTNNPCEETLTKLKEAHAALN